MNQVQTIEREEDKQVAPVSESAAIFQIIANLANNPSADPDRIERFLAMRDKEIERLAKIDFNEALNDAQSEMERIAADANNPQTKSKYASYGALDRALRPIYTKHGFSVSFDTGEPPHIDYVRVVADVAHRGGFTRQYHVDMPSDGKGARGGDVMTKTHATGAAMTYGMRYLLKMIFNVAVGDDDKDGNIADAGGAISEEQAVQLRDLIDSVGAEIEKFCHIFGIEALPDLPAKRFDEACQRLKEYGRKRRQEAR